MRSGVGADDDGLAVFGDEFQSGGVSGEVIGADRGDIAGLAVLVLNGQGNFHRTILRLGMMEA